MPCLLEAVAAAPTEARSWRLLAEALLALNTRPALDAVARQALAEERLDPDVAAGVAVAAALAAYVTGDIEDCRAWHAGGERLLAAGKSERGIRGLASRQRQLVRRLLGDRSGRYDWDTLVYALYLRELLRRGAAGEDDGGGEALYQRR